MDVLNVKVLESQGNVRFEVGDALLESIKEHGVQVPILVYQLEGRWFILDGHSRVSAAIMAGIDTVPYTEVPPPTDHKQRIIKQFVINQHRNSLTPLEKAENYRKLVVEFGMSQKEIAAEFGVSEGEVSISLSALKASPTIRDAVLSGRLSHSAIEPVLSLEPDAQEEIAPMVLQARTVKGVTDVVKAYRASKGLTRTIRKPSVTKKQSSTDPMEAMAVDAIETALRNLKLAQGIMVSDPELQARGADAVRKILEIAARVEAQLLTPAESTVLDDVDMFEGIIQ